MSHQNEENILAEILCDKLDLDLDPAPGDHLMDDLGAESVDYVHILIELNTRGIHLTLQELHEGLMDGLPAVPAEHQSTTVGGDISIYEVAVRRGKTQKPSAEEFASTVPMTFGRLVQIVRRKYRMSISTA